MSGAALDDVRGPGLMSGAALDAVRGPGLMSGAALDAVRGIWGMVRLAALDDIRGPGLVSGAALDAVRGIRGIVHGPSAARGPGPKARQPYWILEPLQNVHRQFLKIPAFSMQKQYSQRSTQC